MKKLTTSVSTSVDGAAIEELAAYYVARGFTEQEAEEEARQQLDPAQAPVCGEVEKAERLVGTATIENPRAWELARQRAHMLNDRRLGPWPKTVMNIPQPRTGRGESRERRDRPGQRRAAGLRSGQDPGGDDPEGEPPGALNFESFALATSFLTDSQRLQVHLTLPQDVQDQAWGHLGRQNRGEWA